MQTPVEQPKEIRHDWTQSGIFVYITVYMKTVRKEDCQVQLTSQSLGVGGENGLTKEWPKLFADVNVEGSNWKIFPSKVEICLKKESQGLNWPSVGAAETSAVPAAESNPLPRGKAPWKKDWNQISKEIADDEETDPANRFLRDLYSSADEDTRRAMIKSYQTSAGTVLSTNWDSVKDTDYASNVQPPDGMEAKRW
eukprot:Polyplicarium_translucidae@DN3160_c0_g1_i4.p1